MSNIILRRVAASRNARASRRVGEFGFREEFLRVGFVILAFGDALLACAVAGLAAVETESAGVVFFVGSGVRAGHETVIGNCPIYSPTGVDASPSLNPSFKVSGMHSDW